MKGFLAALCTGGRKRALHLLVLLLVALDGQAQVLRLEDPGRSYDPRPALEILKAPASLTFAEAAARPRGGEDGWHAPDELEMLLHDGRQGLWLRFAIQGRDDQAWWLIPSWPVLDRLDLRTRAADGRWSPLQQSGLALPASQRTLSGRQLMFALAPTAGAVEEVYLRLDSRETFVLPLRLVTPAAYLREAQQDAWLIGGFFGCLVTILLLTLTLWGFGRRSGFGWYALYLLSVIGYQAVTTGYGAWQLWPESPAFALRAHLVFTALCFLSGGLFVRYLLSLYHGGRWIDFGNRLLIGYWNVALVITLIWPHLLSFQEMLGMMALSCLGLLGTTTYLALRGSRMALWFSAAWALLLLGSSIQLLAVAGWLPADSPAFHGQMAGFALGFVMLSLGLTEGLSLQRRARIEAQRQALEASSALAREREASFVELELRVALRTVELQQAKASLERLNRELLHQSQTDSLTGLGNRRHFERVFQQEIRRAIRAERPLAVLLVDIDHFKAVNDTHGHTLGDECLRCVAEVLRRHVQRAGEVAARYGGEEFVIALPGSDQQAARTLAERIRQEVAGLELQTEQGRLRPSISVGVAVAVPSNLEHGLGLLEDADRALYAAKRGGRNRVCLSDGLPELGSGRG
ncbi:sensor domain-containing diguanylate cyclase [Pseudomonas oryzihabitans]|uniref:sensor domain-containing diguanylate cyclase n=1 Tax=Pseudomonas oryzihabitans TaxID=47885 RepID=UPI00241FE47F|nr:diguanylate cyclase [Pseudomonas oryzihabitans]